MLPVYSAASVSQTVLVQAAPSTDETEYLLGIADAAPHVAKVVGWINFEDRADRATLDRLSQHPKFAGVRPMIQSIEDLDWMLRPDLGWAYEALIELDLTFDCLGFPRHLSQHVGGFVISSGPLAQLVPVENAAMEDRTVIQWDKDDLEALGLLKVDVLALGMLTAIRKALGEINKYKHSDLTVQRIPAEDPATYHMLQQGDSVGVFQVESRAQMTMLPNNQKSSKQGRTHLLIVVNCAQLSFLTGNIESLVTPVIVGNHVKLN